MISMVMIIHLCLCFIDGFALVPRASAMRLVCVWVAVSGLKMIIDSLVFPLNDASAMLSLLY